MKNMVYSPEPGDSVKELRLITRSLLLLALLTAFLYLRVFLAEPLSVLDADGLGGFGFLSLLFLGTAIAGLLLAWRWEGLGGLVMLASGIGLAVLTFISAAETPWLTAFFYSSPFVITGSLSLLCWWRKT